ncbi:MAG TPA: trypsin-like peptidase domain-containing protein [Puia sp.]|jgi:serine protease Do|nr:trypsin-like peptidase domain-containing protein [Puia sp.]
MEKKKLGRGTYFFGLLFLFACLSNSANAQNCSAAQNYALNSPGVVMVKTVYSAKVYLNKMQMDERVFNRLLDSIQRADTAGAIFSPEQKLDIVLREMNNRPARFFKKSFDNIEQTQEITATGTGFFITGDGYVATNCHLIERDNAFIRRQFILTAFQQITDANIAAFENSWASKFTDQQKNVLYNTYASLYSKLVPMTLSDLKKTVYVVYRKDVEGKGQTTATKAANIIIKGLPMPGKDVAVLKIEGDSSLPVLKIADAELPQVGEQLFVYGYPGPVTNNDFVAAESAIEPTLTTGIVSAIKKSVNGWPVIQMDANINHGSSGGPVCNSNGEVVGLTTFGSLENSGALAAGLNFSIPVSILNEFMDSAGIEPAVSNATKLFVEGLDWFDRHYYRKALRDFGELSNLNVNYPTVQNYIAACKIRIARGEDIEAKIVKRILVGLGLLLLVLIIYVAFRKKRK